VTSSETTVEQISEILGLSPTRSERRGAERRSGEVRTHNLWTIEVELLSNTEEEEEDQTGTGALAELGMRTQPAQGRISQLPADCEAKVWWAADSDSSQGGFVLPSDVVADIAALGVDLLGTVYLDD
jgi:hypothetical protein